MTPDDPRQVAERWLAAEPDDDIRSELHALLDGEDDELAARFAGRLQFGTAGLRAEVGAGPLRMNRLVVRQAALGLARYLLDSDPAAAERGVIIGFDARRKSDLFAADTARVMAAAGIRAHLFDQRVPTPVLAWSITEVGAAAGVVVTASHNPPADNGYKVYLGQGAQIVSPQDREISDRIEQVDATEVPLAAADDPLISSVGDELVGGYLAAMPTIRRRPDVAGARIAYTAMHGVGGEAVVRAFEAAGLPAPAVVDAQFDPDGSFPTVSFPNPEEPGAMDLVVDLAASIGAPAAIANDPDADRLGAAIPQADGSWRRLGGDEIGWLLAEHVLAHGEGADRLIVTTLVSSALLGKMAERHGVTAVETFTGFKWIARAALDRPDLRFVFGYEQALGYLVADRPLDKDGITAAVLFADLTSAAVADGRTVQDLLDDIAERYGRHVLADASVRMDPSQIGGVMDRLQADLPTELAGRAVARTTDYPEAGLLRFELDGGVRVQVRPSGTEPKVKIYGEAVDEDPTPYVTALAELLR